MEHSDRERAGHQRGEQEDEGGREEPRLTSELPNERKFSVGSGMEKEDWKWGGEQWVYSRGCSGGLEIYGKGRTLHPGSLLRSSGTSVKLGVRSGLTGMDRRAGLALMGFWMGLGDFSQAPCTEKTIFSN